MDIVICLSLYCQIYIFILILFTLIFLLTNRSQVFKSAVKVLRKIKIIARLILYRCITCYVATGGPLSKWEKKEERKKPKKERGTVFSTRIWNAVRVIRTLSPLLPARNLHVIFSIRWTSSDDTNAFSRSDY